MVSQFKGLFFAAALMVGVQSTLSSAAREYSLHEASADHLPQHAHVPVTLPKREPYVIESDHGPVFPISGKSNLRPLKRASHVASVDYVPIDYAQGSYKHSPSMAEVQPDGTKIYVGDDGSKSVAYPDGKKAYVSGDGQTTEVQQKRSPSMAEVQPDGTKIYVGDDGSKSVSYPDGKKAYVSGDGKTTEVQQKRESVTTKSGETFSGLKDGEVKHSKDGTTLVGTADGGINVVPAGFRRSPLISEIPDPGHGPQSTKPGLGPQNTKEPLTFKRDII